MQKIIRAAATAASLSLAVLPVVGFAGAAFAQERIQISDLQLDTAAGAQTFAERVNGAAARFCVGHTSSTELARIQACREAIRAEAMDKLSAAQRQSIRAALTDQRSSAQRLVLGAL